MFDRDSLWNYIHFALEKEWPDAHKSKIERATERICEEVSDWVPKKGDFWLNKDDGALYVNQGWEVVTSEAPEPADWLEVALEGIEKYGDALKEMK